MLPLDVQVIVYKTKLWVHTLKVTIFAYGLLYICVYIKAKMFTSCANNAAFKRT